METIRTFLQENLPFAADALEIVYVQAALIILVSLVLAKLADFIFCRVVLRMTGKTKTDVDDRIVRLLHKPIFLSVLLYGVYLAANRFGMSEENVLLTRRILQTFVILLWTVTGMRACKAILEELARRADRFRWVEARTIPLFENLAKLVTIATAGYLLIMNWDLDVTPWLASAGIAGVAIGFAAKDTLANLFSGMFILADAPYKIGDFIVLDSGERGKVTSIGLRSTRILTRDDVEVTLPNAAIAAGKIVNESGGPWQKARVTVRVGVSYGSDVDLVSRVLLECAEEVEWVASEPEPRVRFTEFGDSSLNFRLLCWIERPVLKGRCLHALNTAVYKRFAAEGIEIPFPQRVVHMDQGDPEAS